MCRFTLVSNSHGVSSLFVNIYSFSRVNDIGVDIDLALHFDKHVDRIVAKAYSGIVYYLEALFLVTCMCLDKHVLLI